MKLPLVVLLGVTVTTLGCSSLRSQRTTLQVAGPAGTAFTVNYRAGALSGTVNSTTKPGGPSKVLDLSVGEKEFECDISKGDRAVALSAELERGGKTVLRAEAPAGTQ